MSVSCRPRAGHTRRHAAGASAQGALVGRDIWVDSAGAGPGCRCCAASVPLEGRPAVSGRRSGLGAGPPRRLAGAGQVWACSCLHWFSASVPSFRLPVGCCAAGRGVPGVHASAPHTECSQTPSGAGESKIGRPAPLNSCPPTMQRGTKHQGGNGRVGTAPTPKLAAFSTVPVVPRRASVCLRELVVGSWCDRRKVSLHLNSPEMVLVVALAAVPCVAFAEVGLELPISVSSFGASGCGC